MDTPETKPHVFSNRKEVRQEIIAMAESIEVKKIESGLVALKSRAEAIIVRDSESYAAACQIAVDGRAYIKRVGFELDPGIQSAKDHLDLLKNQKAKFVDPAKQIVEVAAQKAEHWKAEERRKAEQEQERINAQRRAEAARIAEEQRKRDEATAAEAKRIRDAQIEEARKAGEIGKREAAQLAKEAEEQRLAAQALAAKQAADSVAAVQDVKVKAAVPTVAGIRARVNWKFRIVDASKLPRKYLMPDEVAIGQEVRSSKTETKIPGVEVYSEDSI